MSKLRTSRFGSWTPFLPQIYTRCPKSGAWGAKGNIPCKVTHVTLRALDNKTYSVPVFQRAEQKYIAIERYKEMIFIKDKLEKVQNISRMQTREFKKCKKLEIINDVTKVECIHGPTYSTLGPIIVFGRTVGSLENGLPLRVWISGTNVVLPKSKTYALLSKSRKKEFYKYTKTSQLLPYLLKDAKWSKQGVEMKISPIKI